MSKDKPVTLEEVRRAIEHCRTDGADLSQDWFMRLAESYRNLAVKAESMNEALQDWLKCPDWESAHAKEIHLMTVRSCMKRLRAALPEEPEEGATR